MPEGEADIRTAIYSPAALFSDVISLAASELLSEDLDPRKMAGIISSAYSKEPHSDSLGADILVLDLSQGPTGSAADYSAAFTAAFLDAQLDSGSGLVVAAARGREASALAAAFSRIGSGQPLVLLLPKGDRLHVPSALVSGLAGRVLVLEVEGGLAEARALERLVAGHLVGGRICVPVGSSTPSRLVGRSLLLIGLFSLARAGISGDLIVAAPPGDLLGLVTGLWAWSWGLPVSAFLLPRLPGEPSSALLLDLLSAYGDSEEASGAEFLERFDADYPLGSLVLSAPTGRESTRERLCLANGLVLDDASSQAAAAALAALATGLTGHARIVVPRFAHPFWDGAAAERELAGAEKGIEAAASVSADVEDFSAALGLLR